MARILVVESQAQSRKRMSELLAEEEHSVQSFDDAAAALEAVGATETPVDLMILAWDLEGSMGGPELLAKLVQKGVGFPRLVVSPTANLDVMTRAVTLGARDLLMKPVYRERLLEAVRQVLVEIQKIDPLLEEVQNELHARSPTMREAVAKLCLAIRKPQMSVLLTGENGTGKEVFARTLHANTLRWLRSQSENGAADTSVDLKDREAFQAVNLPALSPSLIESELFGHERGAFTGANEQRAGKFELAGEGMLLLDEIGCLSQMLQPKLLRVLQEREFTRVGGSRTIRFKARLVCATNRNLVEDAAAGDFREDLYYRISQFEIRIPPLRERREDLKALAIHFAQDLGLKLEREALAVLESYSFPGNIRELLGIIREAAAVCPVKSIRPVDLPGKIMQERQSPVRDAEITWPEPLFAMPHSQAMREIEIRFNRVYLERKLSETAGHRERAAQVIGLTSKTLRQKLKDCGLDSPTSSEEADA